MPIDISKMTFLKILSGGQTGIDQGALGAEWTEKKWAQEAPYIAIHERSIQSGATDLDYP